MLLLYVVVAVVVLFFVFQYVVLRFFHVVFVICNVLSCFLPFLWSRHCFSFLLKRFERFRLPYVCIQGKLESVATVSVAAPPNEAAALPPKNGDLSLVKDFFCDFYHQDLWITSSKRCLAHDFLLHCAAMILTT